VSSFGSKLAYLIRQRSFQVALGLWIAISLAAVALSHGTIQLPIGPHPDKPVAMVISSWIALFFLVLELGLVGLITRQRAVPDLAARARAQYRVARDNRFVDIRRFGASGRALCRPTLFW
jgi:hypothetical protein